MNISNFSKLHPVIAATLIPLGVAFFHACSSDSPTQSEMAQYTTVAVEPLRGVDSNLSARLPAEFADTVDSAVKNELMQKGYILVAPGFGADLTASSFFQIGSMPNPQNIGTGAYETPAFPRQIETGTVNFFLNDKGGRKIFSGSAGAEIPFGNMTAARIKAAVHDTFSTLPARTIPPEPNSM